jgi:hypothetical protein
VLLFLFRITLCFLIVDSKVKPHFVKNNLAATFLSSTHADILL